MLWQQAKKTLFKFSMMKNFVFVLTKKSMLLQQSDQETIKQSLSEGGKGQG